jgi:hypothetical protein
MRWENGAAAAVDAKTAQARISLLKKSTKRLLMRL